MKGQMKLLAIATMLAAGSANAAIDTSTTGNGELFLSVWDTVTKVAYTKDLGTNMDDFLPSAASAHSNQSVSLAGDTYWSQFLNNSTAANTVWMIGAMDGTGSSAGGQRVFSTSNTASSTVMAATNLGVTNMNVTNSFLLSVNSKGTHNAVGVADGSSYTTKADDGNAYPEATYNLSTWTTKAEGWTSTAAVADSLNFYFLTTTSRTTTATAAVTQYMADANTAATWSIDLGTNMLNYNGAPEVVAQTPIPAAAWLLGSALMGLIGVGRRQAKTNVIAA